MEQPPQHDLAEYNVIVDAQEPWDENMYIGHAQELERQSPKQWNRNWQFETAILKMALSADTYGY